jgi:hypothetical protein
VVIIPKFGQIWLLIKYETKKKVLSPVQKSANLCGFCFGFFPNFKFIKKKKSWKFVTNWYLLQCEIFTQNEKAANNKLRDQN